MKFRSLSALLALSAASISYAGGMLDAPKEDGHKSPVVSLGYRSIKLNDSDTMSRAGFDGLDAFTGYTIGIDVPLVANLTTGFAFTGTSSNSKSSVIKFPGDSNSYVLDMDASFSSMRTHIGYELPFGLMDQVSLSGQLIAENYNTSFASRYDGDQYELGSDYRSFYAVGFGLKGHYMMDAFGLELGLSYLNPQGQQVGVSNIFTWNVSLAYKLA